VQFQTQADAYRIFDMRDPQVFYDKEDVWEIARGLYGQSGKPEPMSPTYVVTTPSGERAPEFLLMLPFAREKDNLIGWMAPDVTPIGWAKLIYFQLPKQLVYGPMQIESRICQEQTIAKDMTPGDPEGSRQEVIPE
jgi:uncharacterized membrane protein (UPF0182 family)